MLWDFVVDGRMRENMVGWVMGKWFNMTEGRE